MGEYRETLPHYEAALTCYREFYGPERANHPDIAMAENNLGFLLMAMGRLADAQVHLDTAQTIYQKMGQANHPIRATILNNLGILASQAGDHVAARTYLEEAFEIRKAVFKLDNAATATVRMNLAVTLWALKDRSAIREFAAALKVLSETLPPDHPTLAQALQNLAVWSIDDQDKEFVRGLLTRALAMKRTKLGDHHPETILTLNNLAFYLMETGSTTDAEKLLTDTLKVCIDKLGPENPLTCLVEHNLGAAAYSLRNYAAAEKHLRVAVKGFAKAHGQQHPDTSRSRNMLAYTLAAQGKHEAALEEASAAATGYARSARKLLAGVPEGQHAALLGEWRPEVRMFLGLAVATPDKLGTHAPELWTTVMDWKATSGRALLDRLEALIIAPVPEAREKYQELRDRRRQLLQAIMRGAGSEGIESYNARVAKEQEQVERLERELVGRVQGYSAVAKLREASPAEVARHIPEGAVLLEFLYIEPQNAKAQPKGVPGTEASYAAIVVSPKAGAEPSIKLVPLGKATDVEAAIEGWRKITLNGKRDSTVDESLRERIWDPIAKVLPEGTKQLVIAPAGQISLIPFEAVWEPATETSGEFLVEKYLISYCSTGRDLIPRPAAPGRLGPAVVVADPDYDLTGFPKAGPPPMRIHPAASSISPLAFANNPRPQQRLKGFEVEADSITKLLRAKFADTPPKSLRTDDATEERVQSLARPRVLYFITHGDYLEDRRTLAALEGRPLAAPPLRSADDPLTLLTPEEFGDDPRVRSFLYLAGANRWKERAQHGLSDGLFTAREIQDMDLWGTDLVVASACKTGLGDVWVGEGVLSLRRAFQQAGARTVVSSLWSVEDEKTAKLMARFVELWGQNMPKASALRKAQLEMITSLRRPGKKRPSDAPPFFWAPFICHGQPD
jgi:CHAT domain-containing protein/tetratricopeptide (TPR) repeat protein